MKKLVNINNLDHTQWLEYRKKGIGGSDIGAILGLNPYKTKVDVYKDKTNSQVIETPLNESMRLGVDLEDYVAKRFTEVTGKKVRKEPYILADDDQPYMLANLDRVVVGENAILEIKTASPYLSKEWANDNIPASYVAQCMHYMAITGAERCYIACLIFGQEFIIRTIERNEQSIDSLRKLEAEFWEEHVLKKVLPSPDGTPLYNEYIKTEYPTSSEMVVNLSGFDKKIDRINEIEALMGKLITESEQIKQEIKLSMKEAETAFTDRYKISWKSTKPRESVDTKRLRTEYSDIYEKLKKVGNPTRVFKISALEV